jgi:ABC-type antimicrobial peptide transport system permease subunit
MLPGIRKIVISSVSFNKRSALYQALIISLLAAVITGSLLTGSSVKTSLEKTAVQRLGNTGILVSSGTRYFSPALVKRLHDSAGINCTGLQEISGYCQNLKTQKGIFSAHIYAVSHDFFLFNSNDTMAINPGQAVINEKIAGSLSLKPGDDFIIRFSESSDIPADAPFAPARDAGKSIVLKVGRIIGQAKSGDFSLSINQVVPYNIFVDIGDIASSSGNPEKFNRLLIDGTVNIAAPAVYSILRKTLKLSDIGLKLIRIKKAGGYELRSDRIFLESSLIREVQNYIPGAAPVITYLGNRFSAGNRHTPYSFVAALPHSLYPQVEDGNRIIINRWMAEDLGIKKGEALDMSWFAPDSLKKLSERKNRFVISDIVDMKGIFADSLLMPDFPGISGSETCSRWDAGVPVNMNDIRRKDEDYWKRYKGTPKAFINYNEGAQLWGNNFGPATAIRFPVAIPENEISDKLDGNLDPEKNGFTITDLRKESIRAANESTDFSTLFLSLAFFLIIASLVLLSFAITTYLDSKQKQIKTYFALGFKSGWIRKIFIAESGLITLAGCFTGSIAGIFVNLLIIKLLNTVWSGAVQTDTLQPFFSMTPVLNGFLITLIAAFIFMIIKIRLHLKSLNREKRAIYSPESPVRNLMFLLASLLLSALSFTLSFVFKEQQIMFCFISGSVLLISMILLCRQYLTYTDRPAKGKLLKNGLSRLYYSFYPGHALTPILFIASGIFAVFITGANRMNFDSSHIKPSGGTGGFLLWCDNTIPVMEDMTTRKGIESMGLDDPLLQDLKFVQLKRYSGDDASCLNLNHVKVPPLLGADASEFISRGAFSFAGTLEKDEARNPWEFLSVPAINNTIYGIADQTVLEWGLRVRAGDTLTMRSESGQKLNIIIAGGLKSSVFQGYVLIGMENFRKYFPSVSGTSVFLVDGNKDLTKAYISTLNERLTNYGVRIEQTGERLAAFYEVTNTYLMVFGAFGALGMIVGIAGLGFVLLRNFNYRRKEFAVMMATGFTLRKIRNMILSDHMIIMLAGIASGFIPALLATYPSLKSSPDIPWLYLISMIIAIAAAGSAAVFLSLRTVTGESLTAIIKKE